MKDWERDDDDGEGSAKAKLHTEWECPRCDAHNPSEGFRIGDEVFCFYCGATFKAMDREGRVKFKEV